MKEQHDGWVEVVGRIDDKVMNICLNWIIFQVIKIKNINVTIENIIKLK